MQLIDALLNPVFYPHPVKECQLIETHISWVILTGEYAYKIKKPVDLGFLDFSTLEKRRHYCEEELRLNRRLAPDTYLKVVRITGSEEHPQLNGDDDTIEYAVQMHQFPQPNQLDRMLERGELQPRHFDELAKTLAEFHQNTDIATDESEFGDPEHVFQPVESVLNDFRDHTTSENSLRMIETLRHWCEHEFKQLTPTILKRKAQGFVRECHGDMHLRNIAWVDNKPIIFDCIEFDPNLRWTDVMSEVAFLVMDLHDRNQHAFANRFLNAYLERTGDYGGLAVFDFYLVYRALVRGMVAAIRSQQGDIDSAVKRQAEQEAHEYLLLAQRFTQKHSPSLIIMFGLSGSGKTFVSQGLLEKIGAIRLRSDVERKRLFGLQADESGKSAVGKGIYTSEATQQTYDKLVELSSNILNSCYSVIVDATFQDIRQRKLFQQLAEDKNVPYHILYCTASEEILRQRVRQREGDASDADLRVLESQLAKWEPLAESEFGFEVVVDTRKTIDIEKLVNNIG